jgi:FMN reductase
VSARVLLLSGSPSKTSRTTVLLTLVGEVLHDQGADVELLEVRTLPPAALLRGDVGDESISAALLQLEAADAVVVGTPIYKAAYTGLLKAFLDLLPQFALRGKDVLPLATGGTPAHVLAIDYALRPVLTSLGASHLAQGWFVLDRSLVDGRLDEAAAGLLQPIVQAFSEVLGRQPVSA